MIRTNRIWIRQPPRKMKEKNKDKDKAVWEWDLNKVWLLALLLKCNMKSKQAGKDLSEWFERGYEWILDAEVSEGELSSGRYVVFIEMARRTAVPAYIVELLDDLDTLTNIKIEEWTVMVDEMEYPAEEEILREAIIL